MSEKKLRHSKGLKLAVCWFLIFHVGGSVIGFFLISSDYTVTELTIILAVAIPIMALIIIVVYGIWNLKKWAKKSLYAIIILDLIFGIIPSFDTLFSGNPEDVAFEIFAFGAFGINFYALYELKKAAGITSKYL